MVGRVKTATVTGILAQMVEVEADQAPGLPCFDLTGNLGVTAREGRDRVRTALKNADIILPPARYTINLAPANMKKEGPHYDLAIAVGVLVIMGIVPEETIKDLFFAGELSLDGKINPVNAILPMVSCAKEHGCTECILPAENEKEGAYVEGIRIIGVSSLKECIDYLVGKMHKTPALMGERKDKCSYNVDFSEVRGQEGLKRASIIAAASMHNLFMIGPPGAGKTMIASRLVSILPELTDEECMQISKVYSVAGLLRGEQSFITTRPFRAPHHICSPAALAGGGRTILPGEMSLADHGILFMDEFNLFSVNTIETLRQPLENGQVMVSRVSGAIEYPAKFMLVAAMNPCKCGYYPDRSKCNCTPAEIRQYFGKISRPILDRFDLCIHVPKATYEEVSGVGEMTLDSATMRRMVTKAYAIQEERYKNEEFHLNSKLPRSLVAKYCSMSKDAADLLKQAYDRYDLSARGYYRIIRVARTIADLDAKERIEAEHIAEAIGYKMI